MTISRVRVPLFTTLAVGLLLLPGCAPLGAMDGVVVGGTGVYRAGVHGLAPRAFVVDGRVHSVDLRRSRIEIRDYGNRARTLRFDRGTQVVYRNRAYTPSAVERGDVVRVHVTQDRNGRLWADRIHVRESVRERGRGYVRTEHMRGAVLSVDGRRGRFLLDAGRNQRLVVVVPRDVDRHQVRQFHRLRRGDRVRVDVVPVGPGTVELIRFR